ncbi:AEC family transporter [Actimicrobium sp. CCI2.3]|uniref:AEC family transporter n=1 Tax=Actimicrobium sp. CCI2.3 TaxID=3048616 RepID=UPI002AB4A3C9|nr:AEC family transporter [Actimicrobium sp. CCI2.3]MDY7574892.1 AEC family transporter [Actimicrobium sp. CCI2.3]MEB0023377.1 AEC family transporter [Actimicrobium sp. CCI2.3]
MSNDEILIRVLLLVSIAIAGLFVGKKFGINQKEISTLLIYVISPAVMFVSVLQAPEGKNYLFYTLVAFVACSVMSTIALQLGRLLWKDSTANLFAFSAGTGNTGYFGLPLVLALFDAQGAAIAVFIILGVNLYEFSYGYYLTSRGNYQVSQSIRKIATMPILYAFGAALLLRAAGIHVSPIILDGLSSFKGAYSVLGMMVIGLTLARFNNLEVDWRFLLASMGWKYGVWPALTILAITLFPEAISQVEKSILLLMACVPMAGNTVVIANDLAIHPEKAATAVMASTVLAIIVIPVALSFVK